MFLQVSVVPNAAALSLAAAMNLLEASVGRLRQGSPIILTMSEGNAVDATALQRNEPGCSFLPGILQLLEWVQSSSAGCLA